MREMILVWCIGTVFGVCMAGEGLARTEKQMVEEHSRLLTSLRMDGLCPDPVDTARRWDIAYGRMIVSVRGRGLRMGFDAETGELIEALNYYHGDVLAKATEKGERIAFSIEKADCDRALSAYYTLITGEKPPPFETRTPPIGTLISPDHVVGHGWKRMYKGYPFHHAEYTSIGFFACNGAFEMYTKRHKSDPPPTVDVLVSGDEARTKAGAVADDELRNWVRFLDSLDSETAIQPASGKRLTRRLAEIREEKRRTASLVGIKPLEQKPPCLEIVNIRRDAFDRRYMQERASAWSRATRLCWVVALLYVNHGTGAGAQFEVCIDASDGSVVAGSRPWN